ncbi:MAG TPA: FKBP-type peptidyl-prolyl cis-trans isomerase [Phnomibacter sp.]|nr:FKBP-type peptidyl-prolyl cis-trans isomerase [Phnomibacter sp.]
MKTLTLTLMMVGATMCGMAQTKPVPKPAPKPGATPAKPATPASPAKPKATTLELKNGLDSLSYAIGILDANFFKQQGIDTLNYEALKQAVMDVIEGRETIKMEPTMADQILRQKLQEAAMKKIQPTIDEGEKFLAENKKRPEVKTTESGLQYEVLTMGDGAKPADTNTVKVHYVGTLIDGKKFDSSRDRGEPIEFPLNGVIRGWTEGVQLMPVGSRFKFFIPYQLGYGTQGSPPVIPGGSVLIFDVELLDITK